MTRVVLTGSVAAVGCHLMLRVHAHLQYRACAFLLVKRSLVGISVGRALSSTVPNDAVEGTREPRGVIASRISAVRGMHDALLQDAEARERVQHVFRETARSCGFRPVETPIVEEARLFSRSLGVGSDVVMKEMYTVSSGAGSLSLREKVVQNGSDCEALALRPEGTAGVMRALLGAGLVRVPPASARGAPLQPPHRVYYSGAMFRHERPQRGRFRQFTQLGVELVGGAGDASADIELIALAHAFLARILRGSGVAAQLRINTLGDAETVARYGAALGEYYGAHRARLSLASAARLDRGAALRILDSKDDGDRAISAAAPRIDEYLTPAAATRFDAVMAGLSRLGVPAARDATLVRGLDYYRHTIFEFVAAKTSAALHARDAAGAVSVGDGVLRVPCVNAAFTAPEAERLDSPLGTLLAGGRYDGLAAIIAEAGTAARGADVPAIGVFALLPRPCWAPPRVAAPCCRIACRSCRPTIHAFTSICSLAFHSAPLWLIRPTPLPCVCVVQGGRRDWSVSSLLQARSAPVCSRSHFASLSCPSWRAPARRRRLSPPCRLASCARLRRTEMPPLYCRFYRR